MQSTSGYAPIWCIFFHQLQPRDLIAPITWGLPNAPVGKKKKKKLSRLEIFL